MAFSKRKINVTFQLASGSFDEGGNQATFSGLRVSCKIVKAGGRSMGTMDMAIYGLTQSISDKLSTLGMKVQFIPRNTITVSAGTDEGGMSMVFQGNVTNAYADRQNMPGNPFRITAHAGLFMATNSADPSSYKGSADVAGIMQTIAGQAGLTFENNSVSKKLSNPYLYGSLRNQMYDCAAAAGIECTVDNGKLAIWNRNGTRNGQIPLISKDTGMVKSPSYTAQGISVTTIFNPSIIFGGQIQVQSNLKNASGTWGIYSLDYELDAAQPHGNWFSIIGAFNPKYVQPVT